MNFRFRQANHTIVVPICTYTVCIFEYLLNFLHKITAAFAVDGLPFNQIVPLLVSIIYVCLCVCVSIHLKGKWS